ncbi:solute carrier family 49 member 4 isoform X1 [Gopherus evgoodei]|uniref:solute carrier family 49 member 4 isoform X1 n=1 Tax=Gopherus evgoodei TaxID=1825980 RepID=UPI0011CFA74D|nr:solute carrier family 49 member 4 isoform X1 [Gopherus evgoodei]
MGLGWSSAEERESLLPPPRGAAGGPVVPQLRRGLTPAAPAAAPRLVPVSGRVYGRRWLVLLLFSLLGFAQGLVWNSWGPIQNSARLAFGFSSWDIALLVLWGPIGFLPCFAFMWLMDKRSLRVTVLLTSFLMVLGAGLRCVPLSDLTIRKKLIHGGQLLNGLAGPTVMNAAPFLSTTWFSPDERATATAIASLLNYLGAACAFLIGPLVVPSPNGTSHLALASESNSEHIKDRIEAVLYAEFGMVSLIFSAALAYFPSRPPFPPSVAAASQRLSYRRSFCRLLSNFRFLMIALAYAIPLGVFSGWSGVLDLILTPVHVSQVDAGWIGFWSIVGGCVVGIAMARFADSIRGMLKLILLLLLFGATLASTWFSLTCLTSVTHLPLTTATLYTSCILLGVFLNSSIPIFFELFVETVYPVPEGITCGVVTFLSNMFMGVLLFFSHFTIQHPYLGTGICRRCQGSRSALPALAHFPSVSSTNAASAAWQSPRRIQVHYLSVLPAHTQEGQALHLKKYLTDVTVRLRLDPDCGTPLFLYIDLHIKECASYCGIQVQFRWYQHYGPHAGA